MELLKIAQQVEKHDIDNTHENMAFSVTNKNICFSYIFNINIQNIW